MVHHDALVAVLQEWVGTFMRRSMNGMIRYMRENELSVTQVGALFEIRQGRSSVSELGESMGITIAAASQMIERLVQQGLIVRLEDPDDRRAKPLALTEKGARTIKHCVRARQGWLDDIAASLSADEREQVADALRMLLERTRPLEEAAASAR